MTDRPAPETAPGMRFHVDARVPLTVLVLASMLAGCDPKSTEVGATANLGAPTDGDASGSDTGAGSTECGEGEIAIISGTVHRELGEHTWNETFEPTPATFAHLGLVIDNLDGTWSGSGENTMPVEALPFDFALCFPEDTPFKFDDDEVYNFQVYIYRNRLMAELEVGDLAFEGIYPIDRPTHGLEVAVGGVEPCDAPYADEQCSPVE